MRIHICEYARPDEVQILPPDAKICPWCGSDLEVEALRARVTDLEQELETWKTNAQDVHEGNDRLRERLKDQDDELKNMALKLIDKDWPEAKLNLEITQLKAKIIELENSHAHAISRYEFDMERMESIAKALSVKLDAANARVGELSNAITRILEYCEGGNPCAGDASKPCRIHEHNIAREAVMSTQPGEMPKER